MSTPSKHPAFKAYDIRGKLPHEINEFTAFLIGKGLAQVTGAQTAVLGMDSRLTSPELLAAAAAGLASAGVKVSSLGLCGTEEVYHATGSQGFGIGVMVTASHNPPEYNGMKFLKAGGQPFTHDTDMPALEKFVRGNMGSESLKAEWETLRHATHASPFSCRPAYVSHLLGIANLKAVKPLKVVINSGNGAAGPTADAIFSQLPQMEVIRLYHQPDGTFPHGIPNPLLPENREVTAQAVREHNADLGIAWDGDFDRCFLYDEKGNFINNYYLCALLARTLLAREKSAIVHDPRLYWDTVQTIEEHGGTPHICKVGHGYYKPLMRKLNAIFGGEISGHFYFRDFFFCDTGMLPWMLVAELMDTTGKPLSALVEEHAARAPASDEINFRTTTPAADIISMLKEKFGATLEGKVETVDGVGLIFPTWRASIRSSSNEPLLRLNVEARNSEILEQQLNELTAFIQSQGATLSNH